MTDIDREQMIQLLVLTKGYAPTAFDSRTDEQILEEWRRLHDQGNE